MPQENGATASDLASLRTALERLMEVIPVVDLEGEPSAVGEVARHCAGLMARLEDLSPAQWRRVESAVVAVAAHDAERYYVACTEGSWPAVLIDEQLVRLQSTLGRLMSAIPVAGPGAGTPDAVVATPSHGEPCFAASIWQRPSAAGLSQEAARESLKAVNRQYGLDAARERRHAWWLTLLAMCLATAAVAGAIWSVEVGSSVAMSATTGNPGRDFEGMWPSLMGPVLVTFLLGALAVTQVRSASLARRASRECIRLRRGLESLDAYLAPLPYSTQHLLRATLTQSFFGPLLEDSDPMRYTQWPDAETLIASLGAGEN